MVDLADMPFNWPCGRGHVPGTGDISGTSGPHLPCTGPARGGAGGTPARLHGEHLPARGALMEST